MKGFFQILKLVVKYGAIVGIIIKTVQFFTAECEKAGLVIGEVELPKNSEKNETEK